MQTSNTVGVKLGEKVKKIKLVMLGLFLISFYLAVPRATHWHTEQMLSRQENL